MEKAVGGVGSKVYDDAGVWGRPAGNLDVAIDLAVREITSEDCAGWFQDCHYFVPGKSYKPYLGCALDKSFQ